MSERHLELISHQPAEPTHAPSLLFIPGGFHGAWCWEENFLPWFASHGWPAHALSLRDHGQSWQSGNISQWQLADYVDDAKKAIKNLDGPIIVAGHSMGGVIAQRCYLEDPRVAGAILIASSPKRASSKVAVRMVLKSPIRMILGRILKNARLMRPAFVSFFFSPDLDSNKRDAYVSKLDSESYTAVQELFSRKTLKRASDDARPCLVVAGKDDWSIPLRDHEELCNDFAAELEICPGAHDLMLDTHWEETAWAILDWLGKQRF